MHWFCRTTIWELSALNVVLDGLRDRRHLDCLCTASVTELPLTKQVRYMTSCNEIITWCPIIHYHHYVTNFGERWHIQVMMTFCMIHVYDTDAGHQLIFVFDGTSKVFSLGWKKEHTCGEHQLCFCNKRQAHTVSQAKTRTSRLNQSCRSAKETLNEEHVLHLNEETGLSAGCMIS